jgi:hypothetical protein
MSRPGRHLSLSSDSGAALPCALGDRLLRWSCDDLWLLLSPRTVGVMDSDQSEYLPQNRCPLTCMFASRFSRWATTPHNPVANAHLAVIYTFGTIVHSSPLGASVPSCVVAESITKAATAAYVQTVTALVLGDRDAIHIPARLVALQPEERPTHICSVRPVSALQCIPPSFFDFGGSSAFTAAR